MEYPRYVRDSMNHVSKRLLRPVSFYAGVPLLKCLRRRATGRTAIFILMYHRVDSRWKPFAEPPVRPKDFEKQVQFLKKHFAILDLTELAQLKDRPRKDVVVLTFDDGYRDNYTHVYPVLKECKVPATIFLATDYIGTDRLFWYDQVSWALHNASRSPDFGALLDGGTPADIVEELRSFFGSPDTSEDTVASLVIKLKALPEVTRTAVIEKVTELCGVKNRPTGEDRAMLNWGEVREMAKNGVSFGSHTKSHPKLSAIPVDQARAEIVGSKSMIENEIQKPVTTFAYPYGKTEDYSDEIVNILSVEGFELACSTNGGAESYPLVKPLELRRRGAPPSSYIFL